MVEIKTQPEHFVLLQTKTSIPSFTMYSISQFTSFVNYILHVAFMGVIVHHPKIII